MNLEEFQALLLNLQQNDDEIRQPATEIYNKIMLENPSQLIAAHLQNISSSTSEKLTAMSIILLKVLVKFNDGELLNSVNDDILNLIAVAFAQFFENAQFTPYIFSQLANSASYIAKILIPRQYMIDFIPHLVQIIKTMPQQLWIPSLNCITQCNNYIQLVTNSLISFEDVFSILQASLSCGNIEISSAGLRMLYSFYLNNEACAQLVEFAPVLTQLYPQVPEEYQNSVFADLYLFCRQSPFFFGSVLPDFIAALLSVKGGLQVQMIIVDIFVSLAKYFDLSFNPFLQDVTAAIILASNNFDEEEIDEDDVELSAPSSDIAIFHFSELFSNRTQYPDIVIKLASEMIQNEEWVCRRSALSALYYLLLSSSSNLETYCDDIFELILPYFADQHQICRYYAFRALTCLSDSYPFSIEERLGDLLELILNVLYEEIYYPSKIVELKALSTICASLESSVLAPFSGAITEKLLPLLQNPNAQPLEQLIIIECIAKISISTQIDFQPFYQDSITCLKAALSQTQPDQNNSIRSQAIKIYPLIGKCVPIDVFMKDALEFIEFFIQSNLSDWCDDEKIRILSSLGEMIKILPKEVYQQCLPALLEIFCNLISTDFETEELPIFIDVSSLTDKVPVILQAENMIIAYSRSQLQLLAKCVETLKNHVEIFKVLDSAIISQISTIVSKFVSFSSYPPLQIMAIQLLHSLFLILSQNDKENCLIYINSINELLLHALSRYFSNSFSAISVIFDFLFVLNQGQSSIITALFDLVTQYLARIHVKRQELIEKGASENSSELTSLSHIEISIERCSTLFLMNIDEKVVSFLLESPCQVFKLLFMTDVFIKSSESGFVHPEQLFGSLEHSLSSDDCILCYAAFISLSRLTLGQKVDPQFILASMEKANYYIKQFNDDENDSTHQVIDGALIAMAAFFKMFPQNEVIEQLLPSWFTEMPITSNSTDSNVAYEVLINFIIQKNPIIFNPQSLPHLLKIYVVAVMNDSVNDTIKAQIQEQIKSLLATEETRAVIEEKLPEMEMNIRDYLKHCF